VAAFSNHLCSDAMLIPPLAHSLNTHEPSAHTFPSFFSNR